MAPTTGMLTLADLASQTFVSAEKFGLDRIADAITADLNVHNAIFAEMSTDLVERSTDVLRALPAAGQGQMHEVNELGRAPTQKSPLGGQVAFPLRKFQYNLGWDRDWFKRHTPAEMAIQTGEAKVAHVQMFERQVKRALFGSANYTFVDRLGKGLSLTVRRLYNADSTPIPNGPNGETFTAASHTHYLANATLTAATLLTAISTVREHNARARIVVAVNAADAAGVAALSGYVAMQAPQFTLNTAANQPTARLEIGNPGNRQIGWFNDAEVWVKPWVLANYTVIFDTAAAAKPLVLRERDSGSSALTIAASFDMYPLTAQYSEAEFGLGVYNRAAAAVFEFDNGTYQDPTIA